MNKFNCLICKGEVLYEKETKPRTCYYCKEIYESSIVCKNGHYVCDSCHSSDALKIITNYCLKSTSTSPLQMALDLMKHPSVNMHGPEHHYLVPAVLTTAFLNKNNKQEILEKLLNEAQKRSKNVLGGFCGFYGACGAGVGCGIYTSLVQEASPLSENEWGLCNLMTSKALENISKSGGPRCCKRDSFLAIESAIEFSREYLDTELDLYPDLRCTFSNINKECLVGKCKFHAVNKVDTLDEVNAF